MAKTAQEIKFEALEMLKKCNLSLIQIKRLNNVINECNEIIKSKKYKTGNYIKIKPYVGKVSY